MLYSKSPAVLDQIRTIAADPDLRAEVLRQTQEQFESELAELTAERRGLERELGRHHANLRKLCGDDAAFASASAHLADLLDRIAEAETRLRELNRRIEEVARPKAAIESSKVLYLRMTSGKTVTLDRGYSLFSSDLGATDQEAVMAVAQV